MKNKHLVIAIFMMFLLFASACAKKDQTPTTLSEVTEQTTEATETTEQTTTAETYNKAVPQKPERFTGSFTELASSNRTSLKVDLSGSTYTAKLKVANNQSIKDVPLGEYTATFAYEDIKPDNTGNQTVRTSVKGNGKSFDMVIIFYLEDDAANGVSIKLNNSELELISGSPAE